jgi:quercetin dioxygenase-like cupin family protein
MKCGSLFLILAAFCASTVATAQDLHITLEDSGEAARSPGKDGGLPENDWSALTVELEPGAVRSWLSRSDGELLYVLEGSGRLETSGNAPITLNRGMVARLGSAPRHVVKNMSGVKGLTILVVFRMENGQRHPLLATRQIHSAGQESLESSRGDSARLGTEKSDQRQQPGRYEEMGLVF